MTAHISSLLLFGSMVFSSVNGFSMVGISSRSSLGSVKDNYMFGSCKNGVHPQWNKLSMTTSDSFLARIMSVEELRRSGLGIISVGDFQTFLSLDV